MLLVGYFEGIGSQRGIAWRCGDSLSLREFLGIPLTNDYLRRLLQEQEGVENPTYKAEHVVDLETELVLAASIRHADEGDADTLVDSVMEAQTHLSEAERTGRA